MHWTKAAPFSYSFFLIYRLNSDVYSLCVAPDERIRELSAQLLRAQNSLVIQMVADQLKVAVDVYAERVQRAFPVIELSSFAGEPRVA